MVDHQREVPEDQRHHQEAAGHPVAEALEVAIDRQEGKDPPHRHHHREVITVPDLQDIIDRFIGLQDPADRQERQAALVIF